MLRLVRQVFKLYKLDLQVILNSYFNKYGGLSFLLKSNHNSKHFVKKMPLFHSEMLDYCKELRSGYPDAYNSEFILWNNK